MGEDSSLNMICTTFLRAGVSHQGTHQASAERETYVQGLLHNGVRFESCIVRTGSHHHWIFAPRFIFANVFFALCLRNTRLIVYVRSAPPSPVCF